MSDYTVFGDESGIHKAGYTCYGIGGFILPTASIAEVERTLTAVFANYGFDRELKWTSIRGYRAAVEAGCKGVENLLVDGASFHAIIVNKSTYNKWISGDHEDAFYTTYYLLAKHASSSFSGSEIDLVIDDKSDRYPKRTEVLQKVTNNALTKLGSTGTVESVLKVDSKKSRLIQMSDIMIGAATASTNRFLGGSLELHPGKAEMIARLAGLLGWDDLAYDTWPNPHINLWHFPPETFRGRPGTREVHLSR